MEMGMVLLLVDRWRGFFSLEISFHGTIILEL